MTKASGTYFTYFTQWDTWIKKIRIKLLPLLLLLVTATHACTILDSEKDGGNGTMPPRIPPPELQSFPRWHPSEDKILYYNHGIVKYDPATNNHLRNPKLKGLWVMDSDGDNKTQLMRGEGFYADWSPQGDSIVFEHGKQIYKAPFQGDTILPSQIIQLTSEGRNFFPSWSYQGKWIAYDNTNCGTATEDPPENSCGIIVMNSDGSSKELTIDGRYPHWHTKSNKILFIGLHSEVYEYSGNRNIISQLTYFNKVDKYKTDNRYPRYSPSNTKIAFESNSQVWTINVDGSNAEQLTFEGGGMPDWSPGGSKVVYIGPDFTIWMMNADGSEKEQVTFRREGKIQK